MHITNSKIDIFHVVSAHACIANLTRYFSIIGETSHRWGKHGKYKVRKEPSPAYRCLYVPFGAWYNR